MVRALHRVRRRDRCSPPISLESDLLFSRLLRTRQLSPRIEPAVSDRHDHGGSSFVPALAWNAGVRGIGDLCRYTESKNPGSGTVRDRCGIRSAYLDAKPRL